jgi:hypothetical protein
MKCEYFDWESGKCRLEHAEGNTYHIKRVSNGWEPR